MSALRRPAALVAVAAIAALTACTSTVSGSPAVGSITAAARTATTSTAQPAPTTGVATIADASAVPNAAGPNPAAPNATGPSKAGTSAPSSSTKALPPPLVPGVAIPPGQIRTAIGKVDGLARSIMMKSGIPGMAVAVVYRGKVVFAKGYGVRKVGEAAKVDAQTVFQLASVSKSVGATVIAHEVTAGKVAWNTPVTKHLPSFALSDPYVSKNVTVADMYSHVSGLTEHAGDLLEDLGYNQQQILQRLRYLKLDPFRSVYNYTNFGLTAGAESVAAAAGQDWATLSQNVLYGPLRMTSTSSRFADYEARKDRAVTHVKIDGRWVAKYVRDADAQAPAGGVSSSVDDMAKWMVMVLNNGTGANGKKIASPEALTPAVTPESISSPAQVPASRAGFYGYGFNVTTESSGRVEVSHSGAFSAGTGTNFVLLPSVGVGIISLTNGSPIGVPEALNQEFADLVQYGKPKFDWYQLYAQALSGLAQPFGKYAGKKPPASPVPAAPAAIYVGSYANDYVGAIKITAAGKRLSLTIGPKKLTFPLTHWDGDIFTYRPSGESANPGSVSAVTFSRSRGATAGKVVVEFYDQDGQGTFTRRR